MLKINDDELVRLQEMFALPEDTDAACRQLAEQYALRMVVLTGGDRFSSIYTRECISTLPTPRVEVVDTVGRWRCLLRNPDRSLAFGPDDRRGAPDCR